MVIATMRTNKIHIRYLSTQPMFHAITQTEQIIFSFLLIHLIRFINSLWSYKTELYNAHVTRVCDEHSTPLTLSTYWRRQKCIFWWRREIIMLQTRWRCGGGMENLCVIESSFNFSSLTRTPHHNWCRMQLLSYFLGLSFLMWESFTDPIYWVRVGTQQSKFQHQDVAQTANRIKYEMQKKLTNHLLN